MDPGRSDNRMIPPQSVYFSRPGPSSVGSCGPMAAHALTTHPGGYVGSPTQQEQTSRLGQFSPMMDMSVSDSHALLGPVGGMGGCPDGVFGMVGGPVGMVGLPHRPDHSRDLSGSSTQSVGTYSTFSADSAGSVIRSGSFEFSPVSQDVCLDEPVEGDLASPITYLDVVRSFDSLESAKAYVLEHARLTGFGVSCRRSRKNRHGDIISAQMMCDRGRSATSTSTGQRRTRTRRTNCQWAVTIAYCPLTGVWRLRDSASRCAHVGPAGDDGNGVVEMDPGPFTLQLSHNHALSTTPGSHPCHRKMTNEMETFIEALHSVHTRPSTIYHVLQQRFPSVPVNQQDVYNALARLKKRHGTNSTPSVDGRSVGDADADGCVRPFPPVASPRPNYPSFETGYYLPPLTDHSVPLLDRIVRTGSMT